MVSPKNISTNAKEKPGDKISQSPSPEPFLEPDGMTTIDLNKSDDFSKESELEKAELKKRAQIKYVAQLLFALGSIFVVVILFIMMAFLNKEYHLFTVMPLKINQSSPSTTHVQTPTEEFLNLTRFLNQEKFRNSLKSGKYIQHFPLEMDLCKLFKSIEYCCDIFRSSDLRELSEFCTVNDMLNYLIEYEIDSREDRLVYEYYPKRLTDNVDHDIYIDPTQFNSKNLRNKRQGYYDPPYEQSYPYVQVDTVEKHMHQPQYIDPYNDLNQYQPPENENQYLQAPHIPNQQDVHPTAPIENIQQAVIAPTIIKKKYQFSENMISEIERSYHDFSSQHLTPNHDEQHLYNPETTEQLKSFVMDQGTYNHYNQPWKSLSTKNKPNIDLAPLDTNHHSFQGGDVKLNVNTHRGADDDAKFSPKVFPSILMPLPERVREEIRHHVTVVPKAEHVYKSSDFQQGEHHQGHNDFEESETYDPGRLSENDRRPTMEYQLKVDENGKFYIDSNRNKQDFKNKDNNPVENHNNSGKISKYIDTTEPLQVSLDGEKSKIPSEVASELLRSSLDLDDNETNSHIKIPSKMIQNQEPDLFLEPVVLPDLKQFVLNSNIEDSRAKDSQTFEDIDDTDNGSISSTDNFRTESKLAEYNPKTATTELPATSKNMQDLARDTHIYEDNSKRNGQSGHKAENINVANTATKTLEVGIKAKIESDNITYSENNAKKDYKSHEILQNDFSRSNIPQDAFRGKQKQDSFTATEDVQSNQQTYINPCYNPYMTSYIPFMPSAMPPGKVGSTQDPGYLKVVSVSPPHVQNQPLYVLNPSMFYGIPSTPQSTYSSLTQNPFYSQGYFPQVSQSPYGGSYNAPVQVTSPGGQYYTCNPIPTPSNNIAGLAGVEVRSAASNLQGLMEGLEDFGRNNKSRDASLSCPLGEQACLDNIKCIKSHHVCDSEVHCDDSSDEIGCTCKDRVGKLRLCDGYCDCPTCDDEQGCFGCDEDEYSCDDWSRFRRSTCIAISQRCDGIKQCEITGKDEMDCSILADHIGNFPLNKISNAVGFLHRNYQGTWYPTCFGTELWAAQVCQVEAGPSAIIPKAHMTLTTDPYNGLFINILPDNKVSLVNTCVQDRAAFVECPPIYCGLRFLVNNPYRMQEVDTSIEDMLNDLERAYKLKEGGSMRSSTDDLDAIVDEEKPSIDPNLEDHGLFERDLDESGRKHRETRSMELRTNDQLKHAHLEEVIENLERTFKRREISKDDGLREIVKQSRVVGGKPSQPAAWPWLVSIYKNGIFHCGGVLINELWIVTASHCVDRYWQYYYEIQAGTLRRFSYSPMDQRRWAKVVVPHEFYSKSNLRNDIALMKLSAPLRYNKFVRPICLPSEATAGQDFLKGPSPGTICTTVGWGATVEHGADPDHMREVEVPILEHCKHKEDSDVEEICAGLTDGGKDACQGDSGGPLICRNPNNPNQWYLAGIVSHGEGCARPNEPGVYTKVSQYMGWIAENTRDEKFMVSNPLQKCPGYVCKGTKRCVPKKRRCDRIIDCLLGDDEINCEDHFRQLFKHSRKSMRPTHRNSPSSSFTTGDIPQNLEPFGELGIVGSQPNSTIEEQEEQSLDNIINETEENSDETEATEKTTFQDVYFKCKKMLQVVSINKRCNKIIDCEDGSDEFNCTCADLIKNVDPSAICDGVSDCPDLSDEKYCITCNTTEYTCRLGQKCIDISKRCDGNSDCPQNEDEMNCGSLTNGRILTLDRDDRPMFKSRGIVTVNRFGQWKPLCLNTLSLLFVNNEPMVAAVICNSLGFHEYFSYHKYLVDNRTINVTYSMKNGGIILEEEKKKCNNCCEGLYVSCSNTSISTTLLYKPLEQAKELYVSPWAATIYSNGHYKCIGMLLNRYWIVTSVKCFTGITILQGKYLTAVFGRGKINLPVKGPHEQIIRIVESVTVNETDIVLLRLEHDVKYNRYVQAADLNIRKDGHEKEKCYAIGQDNENKVKFVPLYPLKFCIVGFRCFEKKIEEPCKDIHSWSGTIICDSRSGWYPAAVFSEDSGHCGFNPSKKYTSIKFYQTVISRIMTKTADPIRSPHCEGLQCSLGNCIPRKKVCDGVVDCHGGEDEKNSLCYEKEKECYTADYCVCPQTHLKCPTTNKCFPKSSFCDRVNNCGEFEDEPEICSCRNYLKLTDPGKICDGILHCMDRSDEDPNICTCSLDDFQCGKTNNQCIPRDMVCDGVRDCPNGDDEASCLSLNAETHNRTNAGEVMSCTAGVWHTGCFDLNYSTLQLEEICYKLGFSGGSANQLTPPHNMTTLTTLRPVLDAFDVVWLRRQPGNKLKLRMRTGHDPYVKFIPDKRCHRLFIACI